MGLYHTGPSDRPFAVTPHDTNALAAQSRFLWVGTGGDVVITPLEGDDVTYTNVPDGSYIWAACSHVKATGTTASDIVAHP